MKEFILVSVSDWFIDEIDELASGEVLFTDTEKAENYFNKILSENGMYVIDVNCWDGYDEPCIDKEWTIDGRYLNDKEKITFQRCYVLE
jgi:hypothetical protein